jgi:hypothetical protein
MPQIYTAFASEVKVDDETIEGLQSIEYAHSKSRSDIGAIGTDRRIAVYFGLRVVTGRLNVASGNARLDGLLEGNQAFSISATLRHGEASRQLAFEDCYLDQKRFAMNSEGHGEAIYEFTASAVREE